MKRNATSSKLLKSGAEHVQSHSGAIYGTLRPMLTLCMITYIVGLASQGTFDMDRADAEGHTLAGDLQVFRLSIPEQWTDRINPRTFACFNEMLQILQNTGAPSAAATASAAPTSEAREGLKGLIGPAAHEQVSSYWQFLESQPQLADRPELKILLLKLHVALDSEGAALPAALTAFLETHSRELAAIVPLLTSAPEGVDDLDDEPRHGPHP